MIVAIGKCCALLSNGESLQLLPCNGDMGDVCVYGRGGDLPLYFKSI